MTDITFAIGEVAAMLGISPHTIRAWERRHVVVSPMRTASGQRRYTGDDIELLRQVKHERHVHGMSMRVATLTAQGIVVPDPAGDESGPGAGTLITVGADPLRIVADLVPEIIVVLEPSGRIAYANTAFVRFSGTLLGQLKGMQFADFADPFDRAKAVQTYTQPLRQRRGWELNLRARHGRAFFSFDCWPVRTPTGSVLVLVGHDVGAAIANEHTDDAAWPAPRVEPRPRPRGGSVLTQVALAAAEQARELLPNAGLLVAVVPNGDAGRVRVAAATGVWSGTEQAADDDLRLTLVREVTRAATSVELERSGPDGRTVLRAVPLLAAGGETRGALGFARLDPSPFSPADRRRIDDFAGRLARALDRAT
jgi:PAS domain-containing protein